MFFSKRIQRLLGNLKLHSRFRLRKKRSALTLAGFDALEARTLLTQTATNLVASTISADYGESISLVATVTVTENPLFSTQGLVTFWDGNTELGTVSLSPASVDSSSATLTIGSLHAGVHALTAQYLGDAPNADPSRSGLFSETINPQSTHTTVTTSVANAVYGQAVTFIATVSPAMAGVVSPRGSVQFVVDGVNSGNPVFLVNGVAAFAASSLVPGNHTVTASYLGDDPDFRFSTAEELTETVQAASTHTSVACSTSQSVYGESLTLTAHVHTDVPSLAIATGLVQFQADGVNLGSPVLLEEGVARYSTTALAAGQHGITAIYLGDEIQFTGSYGNDHVAESITLYDNLTETTAGVDNAATPQINPNYYGPLADSFSTGPTSVNLTEIVLPLRLDQVHRPTPADLMRLAVF